jgi:Acyclic terpene utilisation family protein AtuA
MKDPMQGYDPLLADRMGAVLPSCRKRGIKIITNMGAANPFAAAEKVVEVARSLNLVGLKVAAVTGDDILDAVRNGDYRIEETGKPVGTLGNRLISANAYTGARPIVDALAGGADVVVVGRAADPAMFLAPQIYEFGWSMADWTRLGRGTVVGHLLECAGQVTGGYFADPGFKDVPDLARLGFPLAEVTEDGTAVITKVPGSGGRVTAATCKEQLLYEVHDPSRYLQPDVVADFSDVTVSEVGPDRVRIEGGDGRTRTGTLKVSIGYLDSYVGDGEISYAGPGALARGRLALEIVAERLKLIGVTCREVRYDLIGVDSILGPKLSATGHEPPEVRVRVVGRTDSLKEAVRIGNEVEALYLNGPASGGGATKSAREVVGILSTLVPESRVECAVTYLES